MVFLKIYQNSQENTCVGVSFLIKLQAQAFIKKETPTKVFLLNVDFAKSLKIPF